MASRQAHADLPADTYERELGKDGFYGPSTQMYHRHAPTGWVSFEGPLRPRAFDTNRLAARTDGKGGDLMRQWISLPRVEGMASRQAHADLPADTYERELGKEGFYGPSTQMYHRHAPTGWVSFEGPLRPRAFDTNRLAAR